MSIQCQYLILCLLLIISYVYALIFAPAITNDNEGWKGWFNKLHESCLIENPSFINNLSCRGENYIIAGDPVVNEKLKNCSITFWGGTHFLLYSFIGFFCPDLFLESFAIGALFEYYEYKKYKCHDTLDLLLNTGGFLFGKFLHNLPYDSDNKTSTY
jgi:hypothetical protein